MALTDIDGGRLADNAFSLGKNLIINGAMQVAQRGTTSTASNYGTVDRFFTSFSGGAVTTTQESLTSGDPYDAGFRNFVRLTNTTTATGAANYRLLVQNCEAQNIANSGWNYASATSYVTLSFWIRSSVSQAFSVRLRSLDGTSQNYPMSTGTLTADTWTKVTKTIPGNSNITVDNDNGAGLRVEFGAFWGTDSTDSGVTLDAWAAYSSSTRTTDMTNTWAGTTNATFDITGVQLEVGSAATPFEHRSFDDELARCQRYFFSSFPQGTAPGKGVANTVDLELPATSGSFSPNRYFGLQHKQNMRGPAAITFYNSQNASAGDNTIKGYYWVDGGATGSGDYTVNLDVAGHNAFGGWFATSGFGNAIIRFHYTASAEL